MIHSGSYKLRTKLVQSENQLNFPDPKMTRSDQRENKVPGKESPLAPNSGGT